MIAWWGWLLIWTGLVLALTATVALLVRRPFLNGFILLDEAGGLGATPAAFGGGVAPDVPPQAIAVLAYILYHLARS